MDTFTTKSLQEALHFPSDKFLIHVEAIDQKAPSVITWTQNQNNTTPLSVSLASKGSETKEKEKKSEYEKGEAEVCWDLVQEWYRNQGKGVPPEEAKACLSEIAKEKKEKLNPTIVQAVSSAKPAYGTKEFWADYWAKKKAAQAASGSEPEKKPKEVKEKKVKEAKEVKEKKVKKEKVL
jgi:hypothetical protein